MKLRRVLQARILWDASVLQAKSLKRCSGLHPTRLLLSQGRTSLLMEVTQLNSESISKRGERQKVGGPVLATMGRTLRRTTRGINHLKGSVADILQPAILRPPTFWRSP